MFKDIGPRTPKIRLDYSDVMVALTEEGRSFLVDARRILALAMESILAVQRLSRGETGQLNIAYLSNSDFELLPETLDAFRDRFPLAFFAPMPSPGERMGKKAVAAIQGMLGRKGVEMRVGKKITAFETGPGHHSACWLHAPQSPSHNPTNYDITTQNATGQHDPASEPEPGADPAGRTATQ